MNKTFFWIQFGLMALNMALMAMLHPANHDGVLSLIACLLLQGVIAAWPAMAFHDVCLDYESTIRLLRAERDYLHERLSREEESEE